MTKGKAKIQPICRKYEYISYILLLQMGIFPCHAFLFRWRKKLTGSERLLRYVQRTVGLPSQSKTGTPLKAVRKGPNQLGLKAHHLMTSAIHPLKTWKIIEFPLVEGGKYIFIHGGFSIVMLVFRVAIISLNFKNSEHQRNRNAKPTPVCW